MNPSNPSRMADLAKGIALCATIIAVKWYFGTPSPPEPAPVSPAIPSALYPGTARAWFPLNRSEYMLQEPQPPKPTEQTERSGADSPPGILFSDALKEPAAVENARSTQTHSHDLARTWLQSKVGNNLAPFERLVLRDRFLGSIDLAIKSVELENRNSVLIIGPEVIDSTSHILLSHNHQAQQFKLPKEWDKYLMVEHREAWLSKLAETLPLDSHKVTLSELTCTLKKVSSSVTDIDLNVRALFHESLSAAKVGLAVEAWQLGLHTTHTRLLPATATLEENSKIRLHGNIELVGNFDVEKPVLIIVTIVEPSWQEPSSSSTSAVPTSTTSLLSNTLAGFVYDGEWHPFQAINELGN